MGNGGPEVRDAADVVTDSYDDEGFRQSSGALPPRAGEPSRPMTGEPIIEVAPNVDQLARRAAEWLIEPDGSLPSGSFALCLSGGSTPRGLYAHARKPCLSRSHPVAATASVLGRRALRTTASSGQQLPNGA